MFVRLVKANGLDLTQFQFDYDLTFAVFFMNADRTIYGRYGTRSSVDQAEKHMSVSGLSQAMAAALEIHRQYPTNRDSLKGKQSAASKYKTPDDFPSLKGKYNETLDYDGAVSRSCMHCHQVRDAERQIYRDAGQPIPDKLLFPNPLPDVIGLKFDPEQIATVVQVEKGSASELAGVKIGDELRSLNGQSIISIADIQWVLHNADDAAILPAIVRRGDKEMSLNIELQDGWRRNTDISWRVTSWPLRRMGTGGILFEAATEQQRKAAKVGTKDLALHVKHVGQYGAHAAAKRAGFKKGDIVISFDGKTKHMTTSQLLGYVAQNTKPGEKLSVTVMRGGRKLSLQLPMQK